MTSIPCLTSQMGEMKRFIGTVGRNFESLMVKMAQVSSMITFDDCWGLHSIRMTGELTVDTPE
jgi:hypothetical protein